MGQGVCHAWSMAGAQRAAKHAKLASRKSDLSRHGAVLARTAQPWIGLKLIDDCDKIIKPDDPLELEAGARIAGPDDIGLNSTHNRQTQDYAVAALKLPAIIDHEAVGRQIADVQVQIAVRKMFNNRRKINRMPRSTAQVGHTEISSTRHALRSFRPLKPGIWE